LYSKHRYIRHWVRAWSSTSDSPALCSLGACPRVSQRVLCASPRNKHSRLAATACKIKDMKRARKLLVVSALGLMLSMFGWWACMELYLAHVQGKYSREFIPSMKRQVIEDRLFSGGIRFFPESAAIDFVSVGNEVFPRLICAPGEVGLRLEFALHGGRASSADVLRTVTPVREERGCF
jgi:hypothetical protein